MRACNDQDEYVEPNRVVVRGGRSAPAWRASSIVGIDGMLSRCWLGLRLVERMLFMEREFPAHPYPAYPDSEPHWRSSLARCAPTTRSRRASSPAPGLDQLEAMQQRLEAAVRERLEADARAREADARTREAERRGLPGWLGPPVGEEAEGFQLHVSDRSGTGYLGVEHRGKEGRRGKQGQHRLHC